MMKVVVALVLLSNVTWVLFLLSMLVPIAISDLTEPGDW